MPTFTSYCFKQMQFFILLMVSFYPNPHAKIFLKFHLICMPLPQSFPVITVHSLKWKPENADRFKPHGLLKLKERERDRKKQQERRDTAVCVVQLVELGLRPSQIRACHPPLFILRWGWEQLSCLNSSSTALIQKKSLPPWQNVLSLKGFAHQA